MTDDGLNYKVMPISSTISSKAIQHYWGVLQCIRPNHVLSLLVQAITNVSRVLKAGGTVYVRDYATGDMAEGRFNDSLRVKQIAERFFVRADGTRAYYFDEVNTSTPCKQHVSAFARSSFEQEILNLLICMDDFVRRTFCRMSCEASLGRPASGAATPASSSAA